MGHIAGGLRQAGAYSCRPPRVPPERGAAPGHLAVEGGPLGEVGAEHVVPLDVRSVHQQQRPVLQQPLQNLELRPFPSPGAPHAPSRSARRSHKAVPFVHAPGDGAARTAGRRWHEEYRSAQPGRILKRTHWGAQRCVRFGSRGKGTAASGAWLLVEWCYGAPRCGVRGPGTGASTRAHPRRP